MDPHRTAASAIGATRWLPWVAAVPRPRPLRAALQLVLAAVTCAASAAAAEPWRLDNAIPGDLLSLTLTQRTRYEYTDNQGRTRHISMPDGVRITSSTTPIVFQLNGSLTGPATTVLEIDLTGSILERWTITTNILGVSTTVRERL